MSMILNQVLSCWSSVSTPRKNEKSDAVLCVAGNTSQYAGFIHAAVPEHTVVAGGSVGACGGGDALPTRPVQVQQGSGIAGVTWCIFHLRHLPSVSFLESVSQTEGR